MNDVIVVGAGASGMMAAIMAARAGADVLLLEHMDVPGKKIFSTGNGKCNYTNTEQGGACYRGGDPAFVLHALSVFPPSDTIRFFEDIGILSKNRGGYVYPACGQAAAVRDALMLELKRLHVAMKTNVGIRRITYRKEAESGFFELDTKEGTCCGKTCILCCGGKAAKKTGSDGSGYVYAKQLGHKVTDIYPALTALMTEKSSLQIKASGVRCHGRAALWKDHTEIASDIGELQITDYGISGIPVFQVSRYASAALAQGEKVTLHLDFLPEYTPEQTEEMLILRLEQNDDRTAAEACIGLQHSKLLSALMESCHVPADKRVPKSSRKALAKRLSAVLKETVLSVTDTRSFDFAQVCAGGVDVSEVSDQTMGSKKVPGLYFAGEMLDVDGICGGYNLQWAWSSGALAGTHAAAFVKRNI